MAFKKEVRKKTFVFLINTMGGGGAERVVSTLINDISQNYLCYLILLEDDTVCYDIHPNVKIILIGGKPNSSGLIKLFRLISYSFKLSKIIKQYGFTSICSFLCRSNYINIITKILFKTHKAIVSERSFPSAMHGDPSVTSFINRILIRYLYNYADLIIPVTKAVKSDLINSFKIHINQEVLYNPYNIEHIKLLSRDESVIRTHRRFNIITVGSLSLLKNHELLIFAFSQLENKGCLYILGEGERKESLMSLAISLGIEKQVVFLGFDKNPYKYMSKCSLYVHTSNIEGFPNVLVEAMVCGCAVISVDCSSGPREIISPNSDIHHRLNNDVEITDYGILTPTNNASLITYAINLLWSNDLLIKQFVEASQDRVIEFSLSSISDRFTSFIEAS